MNRPPTPSSAQIVSQQSSLIIRAALPVRPSHQDAHWQDDPTRDEQGSQRSVQPRAQGHYPPLPHTRAHQLPRRHVRAKAIAATLLSAAETVANATSKRAANRHSPRPCPSTRLIEEGTPPVNKEETQAAVPQPNTGRDTCSWIQTRAGRCTMARQRKRWAQRHGCEAMTVSCANRARQSMVVKFKRLICTHICISSTAAV